MLTGDEGKLLVAVANLLLAREGEQEPKPEVKVVDIADRLNVLADRVRAG